MKYNRRISDKLGAQHSPTAYSINRLKRFALFTILLAIPYFIFGMIAADNARFPLLASSVAAAGFGLLSFAKANLGQIKQAAMVQSGLVVGLGSALIPLHPYGAHAMISFVGIAIIHIMIFSPKIQARTLRYLERGIVFLGGSLIAGLVMAEVWTTTTPAGIFMGAIIGFALAADWRSTAGLVYFAQSAPVRRFGDLQTAIERMGAGILNFDAKSEVTKVSNSVADLLGCEKWELSAQGFLQRVHVMDQPAYLKVLSDAAHTKGHRWGEFRVRKDAPGSAGGSHYIWMEISATATSTDSSEDKSAVIAVVREISLRKQQEAQSELARKNAEHASQTKSRFLATIGHELRTPLNAIVGFSELMTNGIGGKLADPHQEYAAHIQTSGRHLLEVVNMLLDMSKIDAGKFELQLDEFEPQSIIAPTLNMIDAQLNTQRVMVDTRISKHLPLITADERACRQILINLMSNAVKFSKPGGQIVLEMARQGTNLMMRVSDQGVGMSAEEAERVGEPFFQAGSNLDRKFEGTGLGLSIVRGLVELHEGRFSVESVKDQGTSVTIFLPLNGPQGDAGNAGTITSIKDANGGTKQTSASINYKELSERKSKVS